jgi:hypothetical protein
VGQKAKSEARTWTERNAESSFLPPAAAKHQASANSAAKGDDALMLLAEPGNAEPHLIAGGSWC